VDACRAAWARLRPALLTQLAAAELAAVALKLSGGGGGDDEGPPAGGGGGLLRPSARAGPEWAPLVFRLRSLRESLTRERCAGDPLALEVHEGSVDACARAGDAPELLKALSQLLQVVYPAVAASAAAADAAAAVFSAGDAGADDGPPPPRSLLARRPEMWAAYVAFFALVPARPDRFEVAQSLRQLPRDLLAASPLPPVLAAALGLVRAASVGDCWRFFAALRGGGATPLLRLIAAPKARQLRLHALRQLAAAQRSMPAADAERALWLAPEAPGHGRLLSLLAEAAERCGSRGAATALARLQPPPEGAPPLPQPLELVFKT